MYLYMLIDYMLRPIQRCLIQLFIKQDRTFRLGRISWQHMLYCQMDSIFCHEIQLSYDYLNFAEGQIHPPLLISDWCAKIYRHINYGGWEKVIQETNMLDLRGSKNNHASAVKVYPGCTLKLFNEHNNVGLLESHTTDVSFLSAYNDEVSSLSCTCPGMITQGQLQIQTAYSHTDL